MIAEARLHLRGAGGDLAPNYIRALTLMIFENGRLFALAGPASSFHASRCFLMKTCLSTV
jgi:hypothetical protein